MCKIETAMIKCQREEALMEEVDILNRNQIPVDQSLMDKLELNPSEMIEISNKKELPTVNKGYMSQFKSALSNKISKIKKNASPARLPSPKIEKITSAFLSAPRQIT